MRRRRSRGCGCSFGESPESYEFHPGRTAKRRTTSKGYTPPVPVKDAQREGYIRPGDSVFDYGEGRGELCPVLREQGIQCDGWDKYHSPGNPKKSADVVALNFVLNVIPDREERTQALREAYSLSRRALVLGVRGKKDEYGTKTKLPYGDGYRVRKDGRWTFQKFYSADDAVDYVERTLDRPVEVLRRDPVVLVVKK